MSLRDFSHALLRCFPPPPWPAASRRVESFFGEAVGGDVGRHPFGLRDAEDSEERVVYLFDLTARVLGPPAEQLDAAVDDAARVGDVVGRVEDAARFERVA